MLVLTRKPGESVDLVLTEPLPAGTTISVTTVRTGPNACRQGFEAPRSVTVARREVLVLPAGLMPAATPAA